MADLNRKLTKQALVLRHAVAQTLVDLADPAVPVERRVAEAAEALEALGSLADRLLAGVAAGPAAWVPKQAPARRRTVSRAVH